MLSSSDGLQDRVSVWHLVAVALEPVTGRNGIRFWLHGMELHLKRNPEAETGRRGNESNKLVAGPLGGRLTVHLVYVRRYQIERVAIDIHMKIAVAEVVRDSLEIRRRSSRPNYPSG